MATLDVKDLKGKAVGKVELGAIAKAEPLAHLLHKAVVTEEANSRQGTQKTKTRSEVRGGGRKPYKQKKTGNARQGSTRSPHYAHGGMALAIMPRDYTKGFNKKERRAALLGAMNAQVTAGNVIAVDKIVFTAPKTKDAAKFLESVGVAGARRVLVITNTFDEVTFKCFRNLPNVEVRTAPSTEEGAKTNTFSTRDVLVAHKIVIAKDALAAVESVWGSAAEKAPKAEKPAKEAKPKAIKAEAKPKAEKPVKAAAAKPNAEKPAAKPAAKAKAPAKKKEADNA